MAAKCQVRACSTLPLPSAFDTVDHQLLLLRLERQFGLRGVVLDWFRSYLSGRTFRVVFGGRTSSTVYIVCSVPQGSVLGLQLLTVYTADLADIAHQHGVSLYTPSLTTHIPTTWRQLTPRWNCAPQKSAIWWPPIVSSSLQCI